MLWMSLTLDSYYFADTNRKHIAYGPVVISNKAQFTAASYFPCSVMDFNQVCSCSACSRLVWTLYIGNIYFTFCLMYVFLWWLSFSQGLKVAWGQRDVMGCVLKWESLSQKGWSVWGKYDTSQDPPKHTTHTHTNYITLSFGRRIYPKQITAFNIYEGPFRGSCPRTLRHGEGEDWRLNHWPSGWRTTTLPPKPYVSTQGCANCKL